MKHVRANRGPFAERPYYRHEEIETICTDELRAVRLLPEQPGPVRIDRFIEKRFHVTPEYRELPAGILGMTEFSTNGVQAVIVARALEEEASELAERRIRSTIGHEGGHGLLHAHLFALGAESDTLFTDRSDPEKPKVLCRGERGEHRAASYAGEWWEFQANRAMGALLLPRPLVERAVERYFVKSGSLGLRELDRSRFEEATRFLADLFQVNPAVARIRLNTLYPESDSMQLSL
jgi:hypothetical protein